MAELVICGGDVVDGTGSGARRADVAIDGGRVTAIGEGLEGARTLDATGRIVAPGFIDIHTHFDAQVFWDPALTPSCFHGVTTVVAGNCGFSIAPTRPQHRETIARTLENVEDMDLEALRAGIPWNFESFEEYLGSVAQLRPLLNYAGYLGHSPLRLFVMGDAGYERHANDAEIEGMCRVLREGLEAGAAGFSTSFGNTHVGMDGKPVPSRFSDRREFDALSRVLGEVGRGVLCVVPAEDLPIEELYRMQPALGRPIVWAPLLTWPAGTAHAFADYRGIAELHRRYRDEGVQVWPQVTPRPLTFQYSMLNPYPLMSSPGIGDLIGATDEVRIERFRDARWRGEVQEQIDNQAMQPQWDAVTIDESDSHPELQGRVVADLVAERGGTPLDLLCEISIDDGLCTRFRQVLANDDVDDVGWLLNQEGCALGLSDAGAHVGQLCDAPLPTDLLGNWVRERGTMPLEKAVHKLTGEPAEIFGFEDRGVLRVGAFADVVVFDPATVAPGPVRRVQDFPAGSDRLTADQPTGVSHVIVNGCVIRQDERPQEKASLERPGRIVSPV
ncbi:MAG: amidohydrolase [Deltaproteobacteria bacterium]|nr:amidohydrolase [Deltaproteobacteria bacterium]